MMPSRIVLTASLLCALAAGLAGATPVATKSPARCGRTALSKHGPVALCNVASGSTVSTRLTMKGSCLALPKDQGTRTGAAVTYAGSSVSVDGSGTYAFEGGPQIATIYGGVSFGEQRWGNPVYGPLVRWGGFNFASNRFYPSSGWMADVGAIGCKSLKAPAAAPSCTTHCTPAQNATTIIAKGIERGARGLDLLTMVGIAACETGLRDWLTSSTRNAGLFQFGASTWSGARTRYFGGVLGTPYNAHANAATAGAVVAHEGFAAWDRPRNPLPDDYLRYLYGEIRTTPSSSGCRQALINAGFGAIAGPN